MSQTEIIQLRGELEEQRQRTEEAEEKYKEAEQTWQTHHEQQGEMIVNLEVEVKEWKEKFEKLNNKVQIFMKDDWERSRNRDAVPLSQPLGLDDKHAI
jgi:hypothetical protein